MTDRSGTQHRRTRVIALTALIALVAATCGDDAKTTTTDPGVMTTVTTLPEEPSTGFAISDLSALAWERAPHDPDVFGDGRLATAYGIAASEDTIVAVGWDSIPVGAGGRAVVWTSSDGRSWTRLTDDSVFTEGSFMYGVTTGGPGFVAVGGAPDGIPEDDDPAAWESVWAAAVWTSEDGSTWTRVPHDEAVFGGQGEQYMLGVTAMGNELVAVGGSDVHAAVWLSGDGLTWMRVPHDDAAFGSEGLSTIFSVTEADHGVVAVGAEAAERDPNMFRPTVWTSADGMTWTATRGIDGDFDESESAMMAAVALTPAGLVAVGTHATAPASWVSSDGTTWSRREVEDDAGSLMDVLALSDGVLAVGGTAAGLGLWYSTDGMTWSRLALDGSEQMGPGSTANAAVIVGPSLAVAGQDFAVAAIWFGSPG